MNFPIVIDVSLPTAPKSYNLSLNSELTVLLGPNGSGKTQIMRAAKQQLITRFEKTDSDDIPPIDKKVRFISAGRIGMFEQYRANYDGHRGDNLLYEQAQFGSKGDSDRRHQYETLQGEILTLSKRPDILLKVRERLKKLFQRDVFIEWDGGQLKLIFSRQNTDGHEYSSAREASGLLHLVGLLTALYDDEVGALFIDEPEVSLHPQLQAFLFKEIISVAGYPEDNKNRKIIVLSTHSPEFIKLSRPEDIPNLVFCSEYAGVLHQVSSDSSALRNEKIRELISRMGQEHKLALFAKTPILVEGQSDVTIAAALANKLGINLEVGGSHLLPVIGKGEFPSVMKLFRLMGKNPLVLTDCDSLADKMDLAKYFLNSPDGRKALAKHGYGKSKELSDNLFSSFCQLVNSSWEGISNRAEQHKYYTAHSSKNDVQKKRRAALSALLTCSGDKMSDEWQMIKHRFEALISILEELGCFFLRKGTIEDYYKSTDGEESDLKPDAAVNESIIIQDSDTDVIEKRYIDIIKCLKTASNAKPLDEAETLLGLLLSCVAPLHDHLENNSINNDPNSIAKSYVRELASLFNFKWEDDKLVIDLESNILDINCFPFSIAKGENASAVCRRQLIEYQHVEK